ncbi:uncharacterized protein MELLADRAFT_67079 [Melampsora larici-populina 98AG31]|uniref:Uncharacterized protein n=1 Tax=Melampsora larici-populina (strain 98AG31 / pathotype 3-4-7) TaxID=747676 RepID=F4S1Q3_MELLP|nr:uncharacterized protein MELLADRAFT_67079 [Melampsora larici-populina 98AG31]EGG01465.1 hypothetical protein MELLADRAFT_67079 [Melampsora larici-populina 98AG31]
MVTFVEELAEYRRRAVEAVRNGETGPRLRSRSRNRASGSHHDNGEDEQPARDQNEDDKVVFEDVASNPDPECTKPGNFGPAGLICPFGTPAANQHARIRQEKELSASDSELTDEEKGSDTRRDHQPDEVPEGHTRQSQGCWSYIQVLSPGRAHPAWPRQLELYPSVLPKSLSISLSKNPKWAILRRRGRAKRRGSK